MLWVNFLWLLLPLLTENVQAADNYFGNNRNWNLRRPIALNSRPNPVVSPIHTIPKPLPKPIEVDPVPENKIEPVPIPYEDRGTENVYDPSTIRPNYRLLPQRVAPLRPSRPQPVAIISTTEPITTEEPKTTSLYTNPPEVPTSDDIEVFRTRHVLPPRSKQIEPLKPALIEIRTTTAPPQSLPEVVIVDKTSEPLIVILPESQSTDKSPKTELELIPIAEEPRIELVEDAPKKEEPRIELLKDAPKKEEPRVELLEDAPKEEPKIVKPEEVSVSSPKIVVEKPKPEVVVVETEDRTGPKFGYGRGRSPPALIPNRRPGFGNKPYTVPKPVVSSPKPNIFTQPPTVKPTPPKVTEVKPGPKSILPPNPGSEWTTQAPTQLYDYKCNEADGFYGVAGNCDSYVECKKYIAVMLTCPDGLHYNPRARWPEYPCGYPSEVKCESNSIRQVSHPTKECPQQYGFYPMPDSDCGRYIMCEEGKAFVMSCPSGLVFNAAASSCDWPENVPSCKPDVFRGFTCPAPPLEEDGTPSDMIFKYRYRESCKEYIACQRGHPRLLRCDAGMSFDEDSEVCVDSDYVSNCKY